MTGFNSRNILTGRIWEHRAADQQCVDMESLARQVSVAEPEGYFEAPEELAVWEDQAVNGSNNDQGTEANGQRDVIDVVAGNSQ